MILDIPRDIKIGETISKTFELGTFRTFWFLLQFLFATFKS